MTSNDYFFVAKANVADHGTNISGIIIESKTSGRFYLLTDQEYTGKIARRNGDVTITAYQDTICFLAGAMIRTSEGKVPVETLKRGELRARPVVESTPIAVVDKGLGRRVLGQDQRVVLDLHGNR